MIAAILDIIFPFYNIFSLFYKETIMLRNLPTRRMLTAASSRAQFSTTITEGVEFNNIAREWRFKWSADNEKSSLAAAQKALNNIKGDIKNATGVSSVQRIVCGGCLDFKVIVTLPADKFGAWAEKKFEPEEAFLAAVKEIPGITQIETQTYTNELLDL